MEVRATRLAPTRAPMPPLRTRPPVPDGPVHAKQLRQQRRRDHELQQLVTQAAPVQTPKGR